MHLLDAPVVIALRNARAGTADPGLTRWASDTARQSLFLSALTLHEIEGQAALAATRDRVNGRSWRSWIDDHVMRAFEGRVLPIDAAVVQRAATLDYADPRDALLAATALENAMTLVTFRPRAFKSGRARTFDPIGYVPASSADDWRQAGLGAPVWIKSLFVRS